MTEKEILKPYKEFTSSKGRVYRINGNSSYLMFYSPACYAINEENGYCPVSIESRNPFEFKVDITGALKDGLNTITFTNTGRFNPKYKPVTVVENPRVVIE